MRVEPPTRTAARAERKIRLHEKPARKWGSKRLWFSYIDSAGCKFLSEWGSIFLLPKRLRGVWKFNHRDGRQRNACSRSSRGSISSKPSGTKPTSVSDVSLDPLRRFTTELQARVLPKSGLGQACADLLGHWTPLTAHLRHRQTCLDTNAVENAIRPSKLPV